MKATTRVLGGEQAIERGHVQVRAFEQRDRLQHRAAVAAEHLPGNQVRVVLHLGDHDLVAGGERPTQSLGDEIDAFGGPPREHDLLARARASERPHRVARGLVQLRRLLAEGVDRAVHVRVAPLVVAPDRLDHRRRLLARRRRVQIVERMPVDDPLEDREVGPSDLAERHRATSLPSSAPWSTESGSVTHFIRDGRMSASRRSSRSPALERVSERDGLTHDPLEQHVRRGRRDGAAVTREPCIGDLPVGQATLDADPVAAERVDVLERRVGVGKRPAEARVAEALTDHVAIERHAYSPSSPRVPLFR